MEVQSWNTKKTTVSRSWIVLDHDGRGTILDVDKYAIMRMVQIHARDLRILDPLLSYPSTILGRDKVIVLNLEHIKAIITADEVLVRDPMDDEVVPIVEELRRRLPKSAASNTQGPPEEDTSAQFGECGGDQNAIQHCNLALYLFLSSKGAQCITPIYYIILQHVTVVGVL